MKTFFIIPDHVGENFSFNLTNIEPDVNIFRAIYFMRSFSKVDFIDFRIDRVTKKEFEEKMKHSKYDFLFIQIKSFNVKESFRLLDIIRQNNSSTFIFCFGQHASSLPADILRRYKDIFIIKDEIFPFLYGLFSLKKIERKYIEKLPNLLYLKKKKILANQVEEVNIMDSLPLVDVEEMKKRGYFTLYPMKDKFIRRWGFITLTKGCQYDCIYCSQTLRISHGKKIFNFSPNEAYKRIKRLVDEGFSHINFFDDNLLCNPKFIRAVCRKIIKKGLNISWVAQIRANSLDKKTIILMKKAGCQCLGIGVESGSQRIMDILKKGETIEDIKKCFYLCKKYSILTVAFFMIGNPKETLKEVEMSRCLIKEIKPTMLQIAFFTPYPGSPFYDINSEKIKKNDIYHYGRLYYNFSKISTKKLEKIMNKWYLLFYLHPINFMKLTYLHLFSLLLHPKRGLRIIFSLLNNLFYLFKTK
ncbi:MAG: B12-binding domain-containing radical SAM protein [Nanoarchaeota archaeon]